MISLDDRIKLVDKHLKGNKNVVKLALLRYEGLNYYIRLDYNPKDKIYYLYSINLSYINKPKDIPKIINRELILNQTIEVLSKIKFNKIYESFDAVNDEEDIVYLGARFNDVDYFYSFNKYIPKRLNYFGNILLILFSNLPKRMDIIFDELMANINGVAYRFDYYKFIKFNLLKDDLRDIFTPEVIKDGEKYYKSDKITFLERNNYDRWFAYTIDDDQEYIVNITPNEDKIKLACSCPKDRYCKHIYAVIKEIRDGNIKPFYKVRMKDPNETTYDKMTNFNYLFTMGVIDDKLKVISDDGQLILVPVLDKKKNLMFEVLEDDEDDKLYEALLKARDFNEK
jgi:hypothetical protein